ncbi:hypothetical protein [Nocardia caishijiensis]|uniref:Excreted virulence factor EspC (Type VII ESX diderm) n=1 Tax=Nocardia caishijiensis TaxID=184756 RepID=A0ABQ6YKP4_9NOCA|nr:hypothetical protein [Nocardia caishijiensis]KAF0846016.1 hypothetical protein FNL39_106411 [Nocardia caishijiensis]
MGAYDDLDLDPVAARVLADSLGTAGQETQLIGSGGALPDGLLDAFAGGDIAGACQNAARAADKSMNSAGTALAELGGATVAAIIAFKQQDEAGAGGLTGLEGGIK